MIRVIRGNKRFRDGWGNQEAASDDSTAPDTGIASWQGTVGAETQRRVDGLDQGRFQWFLVPASNWSLNLTPQQYVQNNKASDSDWFRLESNKEGTKWFGKCWYVHNLLKYEFDVEFDVSLWNYSLDLVIMIAFCSGRFLWHTRQLHPRLLCRNSMERQLKCTAVGRSAWPSTSSRCGRGTCRNSASLTPWHSGWVNHQRN